MSIIKRNPFGHILFLKKWLIRILGTLTHRRFRGFNELKIEESRFLETLERGEKLLAEITSHECDLISGAQAFELYDTYGFPLELTEEIANEKGISVDINGFENEMAKQRKRAKEASVSIDLTEEGSIEREISLFDETIFEGYEKLGNILFVNSIKGKEIE